MHPQAQARSPRPRPARDTGEMTDIQKSAHIREVVLQAGEALRARHPWLRHQNTIGVAFMLLAIGGMAGSGWAYVAGVLPWWLCIPLTAMFAGITHELEHDLIHHLYFRQQPWVNHLMMGIGWLTRPNTVNPFVRRALHLHHHKYSGQPSDIEERGITNGVPWTPARILMLVDNVIGVLMRHDEVEQSNRLFIAHQQPRTALERTVLRFQKFLAFTPAGWLYYPFMYTWVVWHAAAAVPGLGVHAVAPWLDVYAVVYLLPNTLRSFCLFFLSSNLHYYGDIDSRNVIQQTQVLDVWWLMPMQLFCCNFGSTHAIHHFAVKEPFYIRQWTAGTAHQVMREMGVRFNDLGTFRRANRWGPWKTA